MAHGSLLRRAENYGSGQVDGHISFAFSLQAPAAVVRTSARSNKAEDRDRDRDQDQQLGLRAETRGWMRAAARTEDVAFARWIQHRARTRGHVNRLPVG